MLLDQLLQVYAVLVIFMWFRMERMSYRELAITYFYLCLILTILLTPLFLLGMEIDIRYVKI
jgi:hypothetical protein